MKKLIALALLSTTVGVASAMPTSSDIPLPVPGSGIVSPNGGVLAVSLQPLLSNVQYKVECTISNPTTNSVGMVFGFTSGTGYMQTGNFNLNGTVISTNQGLVKAGSNDLVSPGLAFPTQSPQDTLTFENADNQYVVSVSNCIAHFVSGKK